jgi:uncharacterized protein (TIRG00374 family)
MVADANCTPSPEIPAQAWRRWVTHAVFFLSAIMAMYVVWTICANRGDLMRALDEVPVSTLPSVVGLVLLGFAIRAGRWHYYVRRLRWNVPWFHSLIAFVASFAFTATPGKAGEVVKSVMLRTRYDVPLADGMGVLLVERLGDLLAVSILAIGGIALLTDALAYFIGAVLLVVAMTVFVGSRRIYQPVLTKIAVVPKLSGLAGKVLRLLQAGEALLRPAPFLTGVGLAVVAWGCEGWAFCLLIRGFGVDVQFFTACSIYGVATLVGALSALPGGLGGFEVVMILLLKQLGMTAAAAALPVALFRLCTLWLGSFLGLLFMLGWMFFIAPAEPSRIPGDMP